MAFLSNYSAEDKQRCREAYEASKDTAITAQQTGIPESTVRRWAKSWVKEKTNSQKLHEVAQRQLDHLSTQKPSANNTKAVLELSKLIKSLDTDHQESFGIYKSKREYIDRQLELSTNDARVKLAQRVAMYPGEITPEVQAFGEYLVECFTEA
jgi:transposase-like protein